MKLTKLYIHNYKSFYNTTIELDKINIVVGENNSGKSNLIDVLEFIDIAMSKDIERAISDKGGYDKIRNYSIVGEDKIIIRATFEEKNSASKVIFLGKIPYQGIIRAKGEYTYSFSFTKSYTIFSIYVDMLVSATNNVKLIEEYLDKKYDNLKRKMYVEKVKFIISNKNSLDNNKNSKKLFISSKSNRKFVLHHLHGILFNVGIVSNKDFYIKKYNNSCKSYIRTYYFDINRIRLKSHQDNDIKLKKDGSNLGKNIYSSLRESDKFDTVSNSLSTTVNEIDGIKIYEVAGSYIVAFKEGDNEINLDTVSDGTINFLSTMVALNQPLDDSFLLVFKEPEQHLYVDAITYMLDAFRESSKQILITSHSTAILKQAKIEEIVFIYRDRKGHTKSSRADAIPKLKRKKQ